MRWSTKTGEKMAHIRAKGPILANQSATNWHNYRHRTRENYEWKKKNQGEGESFKVAKKLAAYVVYAT